MRLALLCSIATAALMWLALGGVPAQSQKTAETKACQACAQAKATCPHGGSACPHAGGAGQARGHGWHQPHPHEYKCVHQSERAGQKAASAMTAQFNQLGADNWRLAKADGGFWCFRRPLPAK